MDAYMVIAFKSTRPGCDIILNRILIDYQFEDAVTIEEKERVHDKLASWLYNIHYPQIIAVGKEPMIYVELKSHLFEDEQIEFEEEVDDTGY